MKKALFSVVALIVIAVAAALVVPGFINWNDYKSEIAAQAKEATGRRLAIDGDIGFTILPAPALKVSRLRLANLPGAATPEMATIDSLEVKVALIPLLSGEIQVKQIRVSKPQISVEILADGRANYDFGSPTNTTSGQAADSGSKGEASNATAGLRLDSLIIEDARLVYSDATSGLTETIEGLSAELSASSLAGPFKANGRLTARDLTATFDLSTGALNTGRAISVNLNLGLANGAGTLSFRGSASEAGPNASLKGKLEVTAPDTLILIQALKPVTKADVPELPALKQKFSFAGEVKASSATAALNNLLAKIGETTAAGAVSVDLQAGSKVDLTLNVNRVNLDTWLQPPSDTKATASATIDNTANTTNEAPAPFAVPADISGTAALTISGITWKGSAIRQVQASASVAQGVINIEKIAAHLPGGANIDLVGNVSAQNNLPQFEGAVRASADNLRAFLNWVGADVSSVPADRLRSSSLSATVRATPKLAEVYGIDLRLDATKLNGGAAYAFRKRPAFSVDFTVDQLNLDVYQKNQAAPKANADTPKATGALLAPPTLAVPADVAEVLNAFDANIKLAVGKFTANSVSIRGALIDVGLLGGEVTVRNIHTKDLGGASLAFQGKASSLDSKPVVDGRLDLQAANVRGLARLAGIILPVPAKRLGKFHAAGRIKGSGEAVAVDLTVLAARTSTALKGNLALGGGGPNLDLKLTASNESYVKLWQTFDPGFRMAKGGKDGPLSLNGSLKGDLSQLTIDVKSGLGPARLTAAGTLKPLTGGQYALNISAEHPDAPTFLKGLGVDYDPAGRNFGSLALKANIKGDSGMLDVSNLAGNFGPLALAGTAAASFTGKRPAIAAELRTSEIFVDLFMPRGTNSDNGSSSSGTASRSDSTSGNGVERWSSDPIDLAALRSADLNVNLKAPGIIYGTYQFVEPSVTLTLQDGILNIAPLTGKLFDGAVSLTARVGDAQVPTVDLALTVAGGNLKKAMMETAQIDAATGTVRLEGKFTTRGHSQRDMVSRLGGKASFASESGIVKGIDLKRLSTNLGQLDRTRDFLNLVQTSMSGGQTNYSRLGGTFRIKNGVARSTDLSASLEAGAGTGQAVIDLPRWVLDMAASFRLTEHPKAPPIGLVLRGPLDNPRRDIKSRDLESYIASRVGKTIVNKFLGKKIKGIGGLLQPSGTTTQQPAPQQPSTNAPPPQPGAQPQSQPRQIKPEDAVRGLLKGLLKQ